MDFSIASRLGYALVRDNVSGRTLVTVPWKTGDTMCFTVIRDDCADYDEALMVVLAMDEAGISPMDHLPEEVRDLATESTEEGDTTPRPEALAAAAHTGD